MSPASVCFWDGSWLFIPWCLQAGVPCVIGYPIQTSDTEAFRGEIPEGGAAEAAQSMPGVTIEAIGFDQDHLHMVVVIPPKYAILKVMGKLKSQSASHLRKSFKWLSKVYWKGNIVWSPGILREQHRDR